MENIERIARRLARNKADRLAKKGLSIDSRGYVEDHFQDFMPMARQAAHPAGAIKTDPGFFRPLTLWDHFRAYFY